MQFNFHDIEEDHVIRCDNIKFKSYDNANEVVVENFKSLLLRYQGNLETSIKNVQFNWCITNVKKQILDVVIHILVLQIG